MVWGMEHIGSGMFFPDGNFLGEKERLVALANQMPAEEKQKYAPLGYASYVAEQIRKDIGPLAEQALPRKFTASRRPKELGSLIKLHGGVRAVDENLKMIIERLEPGVHQFWPMQIFMPNGDEHPNKYFGMIVLNHLTSFVPEQSGPESWRGEDIAPGIKMYFAYGSVSLRSGDLAMDSKVFGSSHLWLERELKSPTLYFSDELQSEIKQAGLRIPKHFKMKVI